MAEVRIQHAPFEVEPADYQLLVEAVRDYAIFMLDPEGYVATWNVGAQRIKGYEAQEIIGRHFSVFFPQADIDGGKPELELRTAAKEGRFEDEAWRLRKDGTRFWANVVITALRTRSGALRGFAKVTRDLSERRRAEEVARRLEVEEALRSAEQAVSAKIRESEERYRELSARLDAILQGISDGITVIDRQGRVIYANEAAARMWKYPTAGAFGAVAPAAIESRFEILDEKNRPVPLDQLPGRRTLKGIEVPPCVLHVRERSTGEDWWFSSRSAPVRNEAGEVELAINIWHDVTRDRRQREANRFFAQQNAILSESLDETRVLGLLAHLVVPDLADWSAIDMLEDGKLVTKAVAHQNPEMVALANQLQQKYPPAQDAQSGAPNVVRTGRAELYPEITEAQLVAGARDEEHLALLRDLRLHSAVIAPIVSRGHVLGAMTLISSESRRRYDAEDLMLAEELGRRAGLAIENARLYTEARTAIRRRDEFLSMASHELRTPLTTLELHTSALLHSAETGRLGEMATDRLIDRLKKAHAQVDRLTLLVQDLLDVSRMADGHLSLRLERFDLLALSREVSERFSHEAARAGVELKVRGTAPVIGTWDKSRIDQILTNLLTNAFKYGQSRPVDVEIDMLDGRARLKVRDRGLGIRVEDQERIFDRFERTDAARNIGGLGLGLWIVRQISRAHGGRVTVESELGRGSTFTVELPLESKESTG